MSIFKPKPKKKCYAKSNKPQCSLVDDLRDVQSKITTTQSEYDRLRSRKYTVPVITKSENAQIAEIWGTGIFQLLGKGYSGWRMSRLSFELCPSLQDILNAILSLDPEDQMKFVSAYEAVEPTIKEMKSRDSVILNIKSDLDEFKA